MPGLVLEFKFHVTLEMALIFMALNLRGPELHSYTLELIVHVLLTSLA